MNITGNSTRSTTKKKKKLYCSLETITNHINSEAVVHFLRSCRSQYTVFLPSLWSLCILMGGKGGGVLHPHPCNCLKYKLGNNIHEQIAYQQIRNSIPKKTNKKTKKKHGVSSVTSVHARPSGVDNEEVKGIGSLNPGSFNQSVVIQFT